MKKMLCMRADRKPARLAALFAAAASMMSMTSAYGREASQWPDANQVYHIYDSADYTDFAALTKAEKAKPSGSRTAYKAELHADIDLSGSAPDIAIYIYGGLFDGKGHTVTVAMADNGDDCLAPFNTLTAGGEIRNIDIAGTITYDEAMYIGGLAGTISDDATISACRSSVAIQRAAGSTLYQQCRGGIAAYASDGNTIENCAFTGSIDGYDGQRTGGIVGYISTLATTISGCYVAGDFQGDFSSDAQQIATLSDDIDDDAQLECINTCAIEGMAPGAANDDAIALPAAAIASGQLAWALNGKKALAESEWRQTLGVDAAPTLDASHAIVLSAVKSSDAANVLNSICRQVGGTMSADVTIYEFDGIHNDIVYGTEASRTLEAGRPYLFTTRSEYVNFQPDASGEAVSQSEPMLGMTGVLDPDGVRCSGEEYIIFTATGLKYANDRGNNVGFGKCYIVAAQGILAANRQPARARALATFAGSNSAPSIVGDGRGDDAPAYNIAGQPVDKGHKGIVVTDGRKTLRK